MNALRYRIERRLEAFGHWLFNNHWKSLALILLLTVSLVTRIPQLVMDTSTEGFLHDDDPVLLDYNRFRSQFGRDEMIILAIEGEDVFTADYLRRLHDLHREVAEKTPYLDDITSLINVRNTLGKEGELLVQDLLEEWPETEAQRDAIRKRAIANTLYRNLFLSEDGLISTIMIKTDAYSSIGQGEEVMAGFDEEVATEPEVDPAATVMGGARDAEGRLFLTDAENNELVEMLRGIIARHQAPGFRIYMAGSPVVSEALKGAMAENMALFTPLAMAVIALILFLLFRRLSGVVLPLLTVACSIGGSLGVMALLGIPFKLPMQILPSFLLAVGVGASVHLLAVFYRKLQLHHFDGTMEPREAKGDAIAYALGHSGLPIVMTSLTTAAGLASFSGSEVAPISDLGQVAAMGVLVSLLYTLVMVPAMLALFPIKAKQDAKTRARHHYLDKLLTRIADISTGRSRTVLLISVAILIFGLVGASQVRFSHKPQEWIGTEVPVRQANDFVNERLKGASTIEVVVDTGRENGLHEPAFMQALDRLKTRTEAIEQGDLYVGKATSVADILKETHRALNENRETFYKVPDNRPLIAQELLLFENSGSDDLEDFVDSGFQQARLTAKMPWVDSILYADFITELNQLFREELGEDPEIYITGLVPLLSRTMHAAIQSMSRSYLIAAVVITLMMILLIGDLRIGLISMIPNLTPIVLCLGLMGWLGIPLDLFTILIGSIAIGLAVDDTIHFMHNYRRYHHETGDVGEAVRRTLTTTGRAMLVTTLVLSVSFFLYMFSSLSNLFYFGLLTGFTIIMALLADFFLAPALMAELHRKHLISDDSDY